jgi:GDP-D-mannose dehydratase
VITCVAGQDGSFLAELLRAKGYEVHSMIGGSSSISTQSIHGILFNYESERHREKFETRTISCTVMSPST